MYMKSFTTTYLSFTTSENLLNKIMERYHVPSTISQEEKIQIQLRVCIVIKYWIDTKMKDFEDDLILKLVDFIDFQLKNDGHIDAAKMLRSTLDKSVFIFIYINFIYLLLFLLIIIFNSFLLYFS